MKLIDETPNQFFSHGYKLFPDVLANRYRLYKQGKIPKESLLMSEEIFAKSTGIKDGPYDDFLEVRIDIFRDFIKKIKNVSFLVYHDEYLQKVASSDNDKIFLRDSTFLKYMLAEVLGVDFKMEHMRKAKVDAIYARFMGFDKFQTNPEKYYLPEDEWRSISGVETKQLIEQYPFTENVIDMIIKYYLELHPEDEFRMNSSNQEDQLQDVNIEKFAN